MDKGSKGTTRLPRASGEEVGSNETTTLPNIKNASAYDKEMVGMNELGFLRKLSNEELHGNVQWPSPLGITRGCSETRIVFNSSNSAVYDGHKLNSVGPVYEFVCISFRTDNLNCFRAS